MQIIVRSAKKCLVYLHDNIILMVRCFFGGIGGSNGRGVGMVGNLRRGLSSISLKVLNLTVLNTYHWL